MTTAVNGVDNSPLSSYIAQQQQAAAAAAAQQAASNGQTGNGVNTLQGLTGNFSTFLKILTTQLTNQDPTNATDTNQFTEELVQFSQVEQQLNTNSDLQTLINLQKGSAGLASAVGYIGKYAEAPTTSTFPLQSGQAELAYTLPSAAKSVSITVTDSTGKTVATLSGPTAAGLNRVAWDGYTSDGTQEKDGVYNFQLTALDASKNPITVTDTRMVGLVTSLQSNTDGTLNANFGNGMSVSASTIDAVYSSTSPPTADLGDPTNNPANTASSDSSDSSTNNNTTPSS
ncbi:MAG TPA: flagellar hook capping FlgD N-terminal domain-containing protein [Alphaproteobacteria bacterium]|nr:flagellar hook capping FlgD N-terminal domain-containing protein [Alphaproteobacteria bacterium]